MESSVMRYIAENFSLFLFLVRYTFFVQALINEHKTQTDHWIENIRTKEKKGFLYRLYTQGEMVLWFYYSSNLTLPTTIIPNLLALSIQ